MKFDDFNSEAAVGGKDRQCKHDKEGRAWRWSILDMDSEKSGLWNERKQPKDHAESCHRRGSDLMIPKKVDKVPIDCWSCYTITSGYEYEQQTISDGWHKSRYSDLIHAQSDKEVALQ